MNNIECIMYVISMVIIKIIYYHMYKYIQLFNIIYTYFWDMWHTVERLTHQQGTNRNHPS